MEFWVCLIIYNQLVGDVSLVFQAIPDGLVSFCDVLVQMFPKLFLFEEAAESGITSLIVFTFNLGGFSGLYRFLGFEANYQPTAPVYRLTNIHKSDKCLYSLW